MIKLVFCLVRREGLTRGEFQDYWRNSHAPLVRSLADRLGIRRYVQSHTLPDEAFSRFAAARGGAPSYDGVAELWFDSLDDIVRPRADPAAAEAGRRLLEDEARFIDLSRSPIFLSEETVVVPPEAVEAGT